ncbi:MAG: ABC transporter ATP-binding protein [Phycisphaerae bacterium]
MSNENPQPLLRVRDLRTYFYTREGVVKAVDGLNYRIDHGQTFAVVGESGCGKSVSAFSIMGLIPQPPGRIVSGSIELEGNNLLKLREKQMRRVRGGAAAMIFQEPMSSLNPVYTCGSQIVEAIRLHRGLDGYDARNLAVDMLAQVGIPDPAQRFTEYPHQMSGGMRQRVMIAMALSCDPKLLIADEPTTALDVTIQAQILDLMRDLQAHRGLSIQLITHDLAVVAEVAHVVCVMYASKMVELTDVNSLFSKPLHPYTQGLFRSLPQLGARNERLAIIPGSVPNPLAFPSGCKFHPRCVVTREHAKQADAAQTVQIADGDVVLKRCAEQEPGLREVADKHWCACWECPNYESAPQTDPGEQSLSAQPAGEER